MFDRYIGIPFKDKGRDFDGCDCWGLIRLIYKNEFNINLPEYLDAYVSTANRKSVAEFADAEKLNWIAVTSRPSFGDVILFRIYGLPMHIGMAIGKRQMIHILKGADSGVERFDNLIWKNRILGVYRHAKFNQSTNLS